MKIKKQELRVLKLAFLTVVASVFGWLVFQGVTDIFSLENLPPIWSIILGLGGIWAFYELGFKNLVLN